MPLYFHYKDENRAYALWKISEDEGSLSGLLSSFAEIPSVITHAQKRLEFLAGRLVTEQLLKKFNQPYHGIYKNEFGKPFLKNSPFHISQSHSYPYVAVIIDSVKTVGIDVEQKKSNLVRVAPRVFSEKEIKHAGTDLAKLCVYWCAKETLIKLYGKKDLLLKEEIRVEPFDLLSSGKLTGSIHRKGDESMHTLEYLVEKDFVLVFNA